MKSAFLSFLFSFVLTLTLFAQNRYTVNQKVEVLWKGKWYKATILAVEAKTYKIHYEGNASSWDESVAAERIRAMGSETKAKAAPLKYGKYGCTASKFSNGAYEYQPKGSFTLSKDGSYAYNGFARPSTGKFKVDASGVISFTGGYFNGGQATPMEGQANRYYVVFPSNPDNRWTCSWVSEK